MADWPGIRAGRVYGRPRHGCRLKLVRTWQVSKGAMLRWKKIRATHDDRHIGRRWSRLVYRRRLVVALLVVVILFAGGFFDGSKTASIEVPDKVMVDVSDVEARAPADDGAGSEQ
ncbi:hypothetical protein [Nitratireductor alexandrii]|uniref:hypothetical protein n=1 Tax=Nitratireductor alexandrii TaxID=2448161 RepID=UPI000FDB936F|nr:hypothetical protein [Nitratireductor alexandrii]